MILREEFTRFHVDRKPEASINRPQYLLRFSYSMEEEKWLRYNKNTLIANRCPISPPQICFIFNRLIRIH